MNAGLVRILILAASTIGLWSCLTTDPDAGSFGERVQSNTDMACSLPVGWSVPGGEEVDEAALLDRIAGSDTVLLGERHDQLSHHHWQLETLRALHQRRGEIVLALEMFPRRVQPALDAWVGGELDEAAFLEQSEWHEVWRFDPALYMDIFRYARDHGIPMRAVNVDAGFTRSVGRSGYDATPHAQREGVTRPAEPVPAYTSWLENIYSMHMPRSHRSGNHASQAGLRNFIEAQLVWDRSMAQGIAQALADHPDALVVALVGSGHLLHGYGVPHQLDDLGIHAHTTLLPWDQHQDCRQLVAGLADAVYNVAPAQPRNGEPVS